MFEAGSASRFSDVQVWLEMVNTEVISNAFPTAETFICGRTCWTWEAFFNRAVKKGPRSSAHILARAWASKPDLASALWCLYTWVITYAQPSGRETAHAGPSTVHR